VAGPLCCGNRAVQVTHVFTLLLMRFVRCKCRPQAWVQSSERQTASGKTA
jgi:hypothetical protein